MDTKIRVMLVDDYQVVRQGFIVFLKALPDFELVGEADNGADAVRLCGELRPDVILMDIRMPKMDGIEATRIIRAQHPGVQVVALTSFNDDKEQVQEALEAGAIAYLFKDVSIADLAKTIYAAYEGQHTLAPEAMRLLIQARTQRSAREFNLSHRELEVLALLASGLNNAQIADRLSIARSTIKYHVSSILGKLGAATRTEAVTIAHQHKLI